MKGYITVGLYEDGTVGEIFIKCDKSEFNGWTSTIGILTSVALQNGVPLESLATKLAHLKFEPSGLTTNKDIRFANSIVDYVFRWLGNEYVPGYKQRYEAAGSEK